MPKKTAIHCHGRKVVVERSEKARPFSTRVEARRRALMRDFRGFRLFSAACGRLGLLEPCSQRLEEALARRHDLHHPLATPDWARVRRPLSTLVVAVANANPSDGPNIASTPLTKLASGAIAGASQSRVSSSQCRCIPRNRPATNGSRRLWATAGRAITRSSVAMETPVEVVAPRWLLIYEDSVKQDGRSVAPASA